MAKEVALSEKELKATFEAVLAGIPTKALESFVTQAKLVCGGMRLGSPGNLVFMRTVITNAYAGKLLHYDATVATFVREYMAEVKLLALIDPKELEVRRSLFTVYFGKARFILALLFDTREAVRTLAAEWMKEADAELPDEAYAKQTIQALFSPVVNVNQEANEGVSSKRLRAELDAAKQALETAKKEAKRDRRALEESYTKQLREQKDLIATKDFAIAEAKRQAEIAEAQLKRECENRTLRVNELLSDCKIKLFEGWLKPMCAVEDLLKEVKAEPLLERAQHVLEAQRKTDRAAGQRHEAEATLRAMQDMLQQVEQTLAVAQVKLPETIALREELQKVCEQYQAQLDASEAGFSAVAKELAARIDVSTERDYHAIRDWLRLSESLGAITKTEAKALKLRFHRQASLWAVTNPEVKAEDLVDEPETESEAIRRRNPTLVAAFEGRGSLMLFLDGHNMLNGMGRYRSRRGTPQTHEDARKRLEKDIRLQFANLPLVQVHLVWDGGERSQHNEGSNLLVHFSGGAGDHRADHYIINQIDFFKTTTECPMLLVTDDNGFAGDAAKRGVAICKLHDFEAFLDVMRA